MSNTALQCLYQSWRVGSTVETAAAVSDFARSHIVTLWLERDVKCMLQLSWGGGTVQTKRREESDVLAWGELSSELLCGSVIQS